MRSSVKYIGLAVLSTYAICIRVYLHTYARIILSIFFVRFLCRRPFDKGNDRYRFMQLRF